MFSIVHKGFLAIAFVVLTSSSAYGEQPPRILTEPLLGLKYDHTKTKFEPLSDRLASGCQVLNDSEKSYGVWFVFARASDASGRTYYLLHGYEVDTDPLPGNPRYMTEGFGIILGVEGEKCEVLDADARQLFKDRLFDDEFPFDMMQNLATDFAARLSQAYGGKERLRAALTRQRIDLRKQPEEIRHALQDLLPAK